MREAVCEQHAHHAVAARHLGDGVRRVPPHGAAADERLGHSVRLHRLEQLLDPQRRGARGRTGGQRAHQLRVARHAPPSHPSPDAQLQRGRERRDQHVLLQRRGAHGQVIQHVARLHAPPGIGMRGLWRAAAKLLGPLCAVEVLLAL